MSRPKVMVVDDEASLREMNRRRLQNRGCEVVEAGTGEEALSKLTPDFHAVVSDYNMPPGMTGIELFERILADERLRHIRLVMTTTDTGSIQKKCEDLGARFLQKPLFTGEELAMAVLSP